MVTVNMLSKNVTCHPALCMLPGMPVNDSCLHVMIQGKQGCFCMTHKHTAQASLSHVMWSKATSGLIMTVLVTLLLLRFLSLLSFHG